MTTVEIAMMVAFVLALGLSGWKLYAFMPKEPLKDDDTNLQSTQELMALMYCVIATEIATEEALLEEMKKHPDFDAEHFWRFNHNRLKKLLEKHYLTHPEHNSLEEIVSSLKEETSKNT